MAKRSAGLLLFRRTDRGVEVFLIHPGGPLWTHKDGGAWSIPKGESLDNEDPLEAARRETLEETGFAVEGDFLPLGEIRLSSGKIVSAWACETDFDAAGMRSNTFSMEWPPRSGKMNEFPEADRGAWFSIAEARVKILPAQSAFLDRLLTKAGPTGV